jgi:predicted dehydrogenase
MVFQGDRGLIRVTGPFNANVYDLAQVQIDAPGLTRTFERFPAENHYVRQVEAFGATIRDGAPWACPLEFSRGTQAMIDRVFAVIRRL